MTRLGTVFTIVALLVCSPTGAKADVVLQWNEIAVATLVGQGQSPFAQARFMANHPARRVRSRQRNCGRLSALPGNRRGAAARIP